MNAVSEYLKGAGRNGDSADYLVMTRESLPWQFKRHRLRLGFRKTSLGAHDVLMASRALLEHAPWYERPNRASISEIDDYDDPYGSDRYDKVAFLDIDGVLNDEGPGRDAGVVVDPQMVGRLARIVREAGAQIVLTSSWKQSYQRYAREGFSYEKYARDGYASVTKSLDALQSLLDENGLEIAGMTPDTSLSGPRARPREIMEWLRRYWRTNAYVILENDTFWEWGWFRGNVVTTQTIDGGRLAWRAAWGKGLDRRAR